MATYHSDQRRVRRYGEIRKSVTLGTSFHSPMPMPFRPDGLPDWDTPGLGSFVSFALENGPLKGRVVILRRLQNGMYVIAPDDASSKNDENRNLDKEKLRKEEGINPDEEIQNALESTMKAYRSAAWTRKEGKNPHGGLNAKGRASAKREGHNLRPPVKQAKSLSEMKRQYSFLSRMSGMPGPERDENGKPTRLLLSLQAWGASSKAAAKRKAAALKRRIDAAETQKSLVNAIGKEEFMKLMFKAKEPDFVPPVPRAGSPRRTDGSRPSFSIMPGDTGRSTRRAGETPPASPIPLGNEGEGGRAEFGRTGRPRGGFVVSGRQGSDASRRNADMAAGNTGSRRGDPDAPPRPTYIDDMGRPLEGRAAREAARKFNTSDEDATAAREMRGGSMAVTPPRTKITATETREPGYFSPEMADFRRQNPQIFNALNDIHTARSGAGAGPITAKDVQSVLEKHKHDGAKIPSVIRSIVDHFGDKGKFYDGRVKEVDTSRLGTYESRDRAGQSSPRSGAASSSSPSPSSPPVGGKVGLPGLVAANAPGTRARGSILPEDKEGASTPDNIIDDLKTKTPTIYRLFQGMYAKDPAKARQQVIRQYGEGSVADGIHSHFTQGKLEASMVRVAQRNLVKAFYRLKRAEADRDLRQLSRTFGLR